MKLIEIGEVHPDEIRDKITEYVMASVIAATDHEVGEVFNRFGLEIPIIMVASMLASKDGIYMNKCVDPILWAAHCFEIWTRMLEGEDLAEMTVAEHAIELVLRLRGGDESVRNELRDLLITLYPGITKVQLIVGDDSDIKWVPRSMEAAQALVLSTTDIEDVA